MTKSDQSESTTGCGCGNVCQHPGCALYGAGGICGRHGVYDGVRCPACIRELDSDKGER